MGRLWGYLIFYIKYYQFLGMGVLDWVWCQLGWVFCWCLCYQQSVWQLRGACADGLVGFLLVVFYRQQSSPYSITMQHQLQYTTSSFSTISTPRSYQSIIYFWLLFVFSVMWVRYNPSSSFMYYCCVYTTAFYFTYFIMASNIVAVIFSYFPMFIWSFSRQESMFFRYRSWSWQLCRYQFVNFVFSASLQLIFPLLIISCKNYCQLSYLTGNVGEYYQIFSLFLNYFCFQGFSCMMAYNFSISIVLSLRAYSASMIYCLFKFYYFSSSSSSSIFGLIAVVVWLRIFLPWTPIYLELDVLRFFLTRKDSIVFL